MRHSARKPAAAVVGTVFAVLAGACTPPSSGGSSENGDTIKIGVLRPSTGSVAAPGKDMERGWKLFWDQNGTKIAGKKIVTYMEDTAGNPSTGLNKATQLTESRNVDMIVGPLLANVGLAVADSMNRKGVPTVLPIVSADNLTQRKRQKNVVRLAGWTSSQTSQPLGAYAYNHGYRKAVTICTDYAFGYETCGGFTNTFTDKGGKVVKQLWNPTGTQDFSSFMAQIKQANPDVVFSEQVGADSVRFVKAWNDFGLKSGDIDLLGNETLLDQSSLRGMGEAANGLISVGHFVEGRKASTTEGFVESYYEKYGQYPSYYSAGMYTAARGIAEAIKTMHGDVSEKTGFVETLKKVSLKQTPFGPERLDRYGNPILNVYVRKIEKGPHGPWNVPTKTYPHISQFWQYNPKQFLQHPVYSKGYQGNGKWPNPGS